MQPSPVFPLASNISCLLQHHHTPPLPPPVSVFGSTCITIIHIPNTSGASTSNILAKIVQMIPKFSGVPKKIPKCTVRREYLCSVCSLTMPQQIQEMHLTCLSRVNTAAGNNINYIIANSFTYLNHIKLISCSCVSILYYACKEAPLSSK